MQHHFSNIAVFGANGAIGSAFCSELRRLCPEATLHAFSRHAPQSQVAQVNYHQLDYAQEAALQQAAETLGKQSSFDLVIVASGMLHDESCRPEKSLRELSGKNMLKSYAVNAVLPMMIAKHFVPLLERKQRSMFVVMSAHAGSISQNNLGGWYAYRAAKAALNMLLKTLAIETARGNKQAIIAGFHPGIVDSPLSKPFQALFDSTSIFSPEYSVSRMLQVMDQLDHSCSGKIYCWDGKELEP